MPPGAPRHHRVQHHAASRTPESRVKPLAWFLLCVTAVLVVYVLTMRYNLIHEQGKSSADVFNLVRQKFQQSSPPPFSTTPTR